MTARPDARDLEARPPRPTTRVRSGRRTWPAVGMVLALGLGALSTLGGCSGGSGGSASTTAPGITLPGTLSVPTGPGATAAPAPGPSTTTAPDGAGSPSLQVADFVVRAPATCSGATYTAELTWTASGAAAATVLVDGAQVAAPVPVGGPFAVVLGCNGSAHAVTLVLADGAGATVIRTQAVSATPEG